MARESDNPALEAVADLAGLAYFQVDADRNVVAISPAMERLTGFKAEEVLGRSCLNVVRCQECLKGCGVFRNGVIHDASLTLFRADGSEVQVFKSGQVFRDESGAITGAVEVVREARSEAPVRHGPPPEVDILLRGLGRMFLVLDEDFRVVAFGADLPEITGIPGERIRGMPVGQLLGEELFGEDAAFRAAVAAGERREGWRAILQGPTGPGRPVSLSVGPIDPSETCGGLGGRHVIMVRPEEEHAATPSFKGIVARSPSMHRIFRVIELLRDNDSTVLITGESGTGKELVARALHATSHRREGPFVAVNCAAIPPDLLESELFGHVRGAFTGAVKDRPGRFELADGGTLFLDEIGDLALPLQAKILRFLQERTYERVGESKSRTVDVRVIAATHVNLVQAVSERRFREDLYYRLRVVPIHIPPLRDRLEDLELLIRYFLRKLGQERGRSLRLAPPASRALLTYSWPGNVRELRNALEYATTVCEGQTIHVGDLPREIWTSSAEGAVSGDEAVSGAGRERTRPTDPSPPRPPDAPTVEQLERARIATALEEAHYRRQEAAQRLGISRTTLWRKMKQYGL
ncbi:MAG: sigma 54-interacting transcriptional regulator [Gemmatimonadota bacterium]